MREIQILDPADARRAAQCFRVFSFLRPHLDEAEFIRRLSVQAAEGYKIAFIELGGEVVAAAGYRVAHFLAWGRALYLDDLITHPEKKRMGLASALIDWILEQAKTLACDEVHLDSGYQRHDAHRLYLNKGFDLRSHHFSRKARLNAG